MSVKQKLYDAQEKKNLEKINEVLSEDYVWVQHSTGKHIPRDEVNIFIMSGEGPKTESQRIIYENDEIGVGHFFVSFEETTLLIWENLRFSLSTGKKEPSRSGHSMSEMPSANNSSIPNSKASSEFSNR